MLQNVDCTTSSKLPSTRPGPFLHNYTVMCPSLHCSFHGALGQLNDRQKKSQEQKNVPDRFASIAPSASSAGWRRGGDRQVYLVTVNLQSVSSAYARDRPLQSTSPARRAYLRTGSDPQEQSGHHLLQRRTQWRRRTADRRSCACSCSAFSSARLSRRRGATSPSAWTSC